MDDLGSLTTYAIAIGIGIFAFFAIAYYLYRWIFSIERQLWNQKMQIELLIIIAEKLGADTNNEDFQRLKQSNRK